MHICKPTVQLCKVAMGASGPYSKVFLQDMCALNPEERGTHLLAEVLKDGRTLPEILLCLKFSIVNRMMTIRREQTKAGFCEKRNEMELLFSEGRGELVAQGHVE